MSDFSFRWRPADRLRLSLGLSLVFLAAAPLPGAAAPGGTQTQTASVTGRVVNAAGEPVPSATVTLRQTTAGFERSLTADREGRFEFSALSAGDYTVTALAPGFSLSAENLRLEARQKRDLRIRLLPGTFAESVTVMGTRIAPTPEAVRRIPGSVEVLDSETLEKSHVLTSSEALRKVSGLNVRDEEGLGLRPNIGIRGLNPTRSTKTLLLEDGIPLTFAPYGDNASYYHPPIERFEAIEVLKGSGQIAYGPMTVGGVINYLTPSPPLEPSGTFTLTGGNRRYLNGHASFGTTFGRTGILASYARKQGKGSRENIDSKLEDIALKIATDLSSRQALTLRASLFREDSQVTYSGLTQAEYEVNPRQNPFANDFFEGDRLGASATHAMRLGEGAALTTNLYASRFSRDWWRQSSNSRERPNDSADPNCGGMANLNASCGNQGRLRRYALWGIEPRLRLSHRIFGVASEAEMGLRAHFERQDRRQQNGETPKARRGVVVEDNERKNSAYAAFLQNRFLLGRWTVTPGVRVEEIRFERTNRLGNGGAGVTGRTERRQLVPGLGVAYNLALETTLFAGAHRGFAPPRTEDVIANATGGVVDLNAELSWNYELGFRSRIAPGLRLDATLFRMDYENQIVPASLAGGAGATLTNGGETLHEGLEISLAAESAPLFRSLHNVSLRLAYTSLTVAEFRGTRFSGVPGFERVSVTGNRLPYAPETMLTASVGYEHPFGVSGSLEAVTVSEQFADDLNTREPSEDGQRGIIPGYAVWNATLQYEVPALKTAFFLAAKNLLNKTYIVDRSRGILPGSPRLLQAGVRMRL